MKEILFGWITKGQYNLNFLDSIIACIEIFALMFLIIYVIYVICKFKEGVKKMKDILKKYKIKSKKELIKKGEKMKNIFKENKELKEENEKLKRENTEIRGWKYTIDTIEDLDKLKELDLIKIKGKEYISKDKIREEIEMLENELKNNENIEYTRKLIYTADETIKKEIQDLEKLLEE